MNRKKKKSSNNITKNILEAQKIEEMYNHVIHMIKLGIPNKYVIEARSSPLIIRTYTTYGIYEDPIS